jgi:molybdopterin converting factor small subunit
MTVTFHIPGALRQFTGGRARVEVNPAAATLGDALSALWTLYPALRDRIATEQGVVREHINLFVGEENSRFIGGVSAEVKAGTEISIISAASGG